jgi:hypothetical protein
MAERIARSRYYGGNNAATAFPDRPYLINAWDYVAIDLLCMYCLSITGEQIAAAVRDGMPVENIGRYRYAKWKVVAERWPQLVTGEVSK